MDWPATLSIKWRSAVLVYIYSKILLRHEFYFGQWKKYHLIWLFENMILEEQF